MNTEKSIWIRIVVGTFLLGCLVSTARPEGASNTWLAAVQDETINSGSAVEKSDGWEKPIPLGFWLDYTLVSDYVWRGQNLSEYAGEGREKVNHQATVGLSYDTGAFGTFSGAIWFEWFAGQTSLSPTSNGNLQEVDYALSWSYELSPIATTVELGWIGYQFPQASGDADFTNEWYVSLGFDDSGLFGTEGAVLNPYIAYYMDVDDLHGSWIEWGISHDFALADCVSENAPILKDMTLTPSFVMGIDDGQISGSTKVANLQYGLDVAYDLGSALGLDEQYGGVTLTGFLRFSDAVYDKVLNDEFWGGVTIAYEW
jgi:hypothetical protein